MTDVGRLTRCNLCGDFHFTTDAFTECDDCCIAVTRIRGHMERLGGNVLVVGDTIVIRTAEQMRSPAWRALYEVDLARVLATGRHLRLFS